MPESSAAARHLAAVRHTVRRSPVSFTLKTQTLAMLSLGLVCEAGEAGDILKKHLFHDHPLDQDLSTKLKKELGDVAYYFVGLIDELGWDLDEILGGNADKVMARYPEGFSTERSLQRVDMTQVAKPVGERNEVADTSPRKKFWDSSWILDMPVDRSGFRGHAHIHQSWDPNTRSEALCSHFKDNWYAHQWVTLSEPPDLPSQVKGQDRFKAIEEWIPTIRHALRVWWASPYSGGSRVDPRAIAYCEEHFRWLQIWSRSPRVDPEVMLCIYTDLRTALHEIYDWNFLYEQRRFKSPFRVGQNTPLDIFMNADQAIMSECFPDQYEDECRMLEPNA